MSTTAVDLTALALDLAQSARAASYDVAKLSGQQRNDVLRRLADAIRSSAAELQAENAKDIAAAENHGLTTAMIDRLRLTDQRIAAMADAVEQVAAQTDPVGETISATVRPNGLRVEKRRVPIGVVAIIFESRPNVTSDAAALCLKSANACILRGGKEAFHSNVSIGRCIADALADAGVNPKAVQVVDTTDRDLVPILLKQDRYIDLVIPRGGESLIRAVVEQSTIPVIKHYTGNCHLYLDRAANRNIAADIAINGKCQRPGVCNSLETLLFHRDVAADLLPDICGRLKDSGVEIRGCETTRSLFPEAIQATKDDWHTEYLDLIIAVKVVDSLADAVDHINAFGSHHTDAIVTDDIRAADQFVAGVDSSSVMVNCSTRFSDGGVFGLGAEIGISTDKLHARGPMGAADLTTYKYVVTGQGQIRS